MEVGMKMNDGYDAKVTTGEYKFEAVLGSNNEKNG